MSDWLRLGPMKIQINSFDPAHATIKNLLFDHECDSMTRYLGPHLDFPPGRMNGRSRRNDWTMKKQEYSFDIFHEKFILKDLHYKTSLNFSAWPIESNDINFEKLGRRIEHITNLNTDASKGYSEPYMVRIDSTSNVL